MHLKIVGAFFQIIGWHTVAQNLTKPHNVSGLYANVFRPANVPAENKLPVVVVSTEHRMIVWWPPRSELFLLVVLRWSFRVW